VVGDRIRPPACADYQPQRADNPLDFFDGHHKTGYRAVVDAAAVGLGFETLVSVVMAREDANTIDAFERALVEVPGVRHAERLFGDPDYLLRVVTADLHGYAALRDERLATLPGVQRLTSTIVMKRVVEERPLPVTSAPRHRSP
jgi:DNA-binding Lrp family transcriptional regulator